MEFLPLKRELRRQARRLRRRQRWRVGLYAGSQLLAGFGVVMAVAVVGLRQHWWTSTVVFAGAVVAALAFGARLAWLFRRPWPDVQALLKLDAQRTGQDMFGSARAFLDVAQPTDFMQATLHRAHRELQKKDLGSQIRRSVPLSVPESLPLTIFTWVLVVVVAWLPWPQATARPRLSAVPTPSLATAPSSPALPKLQLAAVDRQLFEQWAKELAEEALQQKDPAVRQWLQQLQALAEDVRAGRLTVSEAFQRLAQLEAQRQKLESQSGEDLARTREQLRQAAEWLRKDRLTRDLAEALGQHDDDQAARQLDALAQRLLKNNERQRLAKALEKVADILRPREQGRLDDLRKQQDRLQKQEQQQPLSSEEREQLQRLQQEIERLERQQAIAQNENRETLQRLARQMKQAAEELRRPPEDSDGPQGQPSLKRAADELRRLAERSAAERAAAQARSRTADLRELLRQAESDRGEGGGQQGRQGSLRDFYRMAQGNDESGASSTGQSGNGAKEGAAGSGTAGTKPCGHPVGSSCGCSGNGGKSGAEQLSRTGGQGSGTSQDGGDGIGTAHDPNVQGPRTHSEGHTQEHFVPGKAEAEPSRSRVIFSSAGAGFTSRGYRKVHQDYSGVVEEALQRERIPAGMRGYIRRYFDLIRPQ